MARPALPAPVPDDRPRVQRRAMRVLLIDDRDRLLLFRDSDPGLDPRPHFWITPGGGVDPGENDTEAAVREIAEETGLTIAASDLIGPVAQRVVLHGYSDVVTTQDEVFWAVRCAAFEISTAGHTEGELASMTEHHWWSRDDIAATDEDIWPASVLTLWDLADDARTTDVAVLDLGWSEESSVAAR